MNYEIGKQYEMKVVDIRKDSAGHNYIALHDDDPSKEYRVKEHQGLVPVPLIIAKRLNSIRETRRFTKPSQTNGYLIF